MRRQSRLEVWEKSRKAAKKALEGLRESGDYNKTNTKRLNSLIVKAYSAYDPHSVGQNSLPKKSGYMRTSVKGMSNLGTLRVMIADNHDKEEILEMLDYIMSKEKQ